MKKHIINSTLLRIGILAGSLVFSGCILSEKKMNKVSKKGFSGAPAAEWVYVPEYYVYKDGRYRFMKGYYRKISPEHYWRRSVRGTHPGS